MESLQVCSLSYSPGLNESPESTAWVQEQIAWELQFVPAPSQGWGGICSSPRQCGTPCAPLLCF